MSQNIDELAANIVGFENLSEAEAKKVAQSVYQDGIVNRLEAEKLFKINNLLSGHNEKWDRQFVETVKDFLLTVEAPVGWVTEEEGDWLMEQIGQDDRVKLGSEVDLLVSVLRFAEGAPVSLSRFALDCVCNRVRNAGRAMPENIERLRYILFAAAGERQSWVSRYEATALFKLNDDISNAKNDPSWNDLFARAIGNHLLASAHPNAVDEAEAFRREIWMKDTSSGALGFFAKMGGTFASGDWFKHLTHSDEKAMKARNAAVEAAQREGEVVTDDETAWFVKRLGWDNAVSPAEQALVKFLKEEAPGFVDGVTVAAA